MNLAFGQHKQCVALPLVPAIARAAPPGHHHDHDDHIVTMRLLIISLSLLGLGRTFLATLSQALRIKLPPPPRVR